MGLDYQNLAPLFKGFMKRPNLKTYVIELSSDSEAQERKFEKVLENWRVANGPIFSWRKLLTLKQRYGDES